LQDDTQLSQAKALLKQHETERFLRIRAEYEAQKQEGKARTFLDIAKENPVRYVAYLVMIAGLIYISLVPFLALVS